MTNLETFIVGGGANAMAVQCDCACNPEGQGNPVMAVAETFIICQPVGESDSLQCNCACDAEGQGNPSMVKQAQSDKGDSAVEQQMGEVTLLTLPVTIS